MINTKEKRRSDFEFCVLWQTKLMVRKPQEKIDVHLEGSDYKFTGNHLILIVLLIQNNPLQLKCVCSESWFKMVSVSVHIAY